MASILCSGFYLINDPFILKLEDQLEKYRLDYPQEKIYVHTDRLIYLAGEDVWFKVYLRDASSMLPSETSSVAYVELIDEHKKVVSKKNILVQDGSGAGEFSLPIDMSIGDYTIRAYTNFMSNFEVSFFFKKSIKVIGAQSKKLASEALITSDGIEAVFLPEGGDLVDGISSRVGFKITDIESGNGVSVGGKILNSHGEVVAFLKSLKFGLGFFELTPDISQQYIAEIDFNGEIYEFPLPHVMEQGYVMKVLNQTNEELVVQLSTNIESGLQDLFVVGQMRSSLFYAGKIETEKMVGEIKISKDSLPDGIAQVTIFNSMKEPLCERLVFIEKVENKHTLSISAPSATYEVREKVNLDLSIQNDKEVEVGGDLSLTVINAGFEETKDDAENIKSWMLLNSDLRGKVEQAGFYFSDEKKSTKLLLDILMMTQGWRRFSWKQIKEGDFPEIKYLPEYGFNFKGYITKKATDKRQAANVYLTVMGEQLEFLELETDSVGNFLFHNIHFVDTATVVLQARKHFANHEKQKEKKKNQNKLLGSKLLDIHFQRDALIGVDELADSPKLVFSDNQVAVYNEKYDKLVDEKRLYGDLSIDLTGVTIKAKKLRKNMTAMEKLDSRAVILKQRIVLDSIENIPTGSVLQLLRMTPGLRVGGSPFQETVSAAGGPPSLTRDSGGTRQNVQIVLDDEPVDISVLHNLAPERIHFIDVYDLISIQGQLPGPAILVYTRSKTGVSSIKQNGIMNIKQLGYSKIREFYVPKYELQNQKTKKLDARTTLHWDPGIRTKETNGVSFFTCDEVGDYDVVVEGMTEDGVPVFGKFRFKVQ